MKTIDWTILAAVAVLAGLVLYQPAMATERLDCTHTGISKPADQIERVKGGFVLRKGDESKVYAPIKGERCTILEVVR